MSVLAFLQVPGLVEKRPNLIIGDVVYLRQTSISRYHLCPACLANAAFAAITDMCLPQNIVHDMCMLFKCDSDLMYVVLHNVNAVMLQGLILLTGCMTISKLF